MPTKTATKRHFEPGVLEEAARKRTQHRIVRAYLDALEYRQTLSSSRQVNPERLEDRLDQVNAELATATSLERVRLTQERLDLEESLAYVGEDNGDEMFNELEEDFVAVAKEWAERKGITYSTLREVGVPAAVLTRAEVPRTRRRRQ